MQALDEVLADKATVTRLLSPESDQPPFVLVAGTDVELVTLPLNAWRVVVVAY